MLKLKGHLKIEQLKESLYDMLFEWSKKNLFVKHFQLVSMNEWKETYLSIASVSWKAELLLIQFNTNIKPISSSQFNTTRNRDTQNLFEKRGIYTGHHKVMKVVPINIFPQRIAIIRILKFVGLGRAGKIRKSKNFPDSKISVAKTFRTKFVNFQIRDKYA